MAKANKPTKNVQPLEILALMASLFYVHSFNTVLHRAAVDFRSEHPDFYTLIFVLLVTGYYLYRRKSLSVIATVSLTIVATASVIWYFGYLLNF